MIPIGLVGRCPAESAEGKFNHPRSRARGPEDTEVRGEEGARLLGELDGFGGMLSLIPAFLNPKSSNVCHGEEKERRVSSRGVLWL